MQPVKLSKRAEFALGVLVGGGRFVDRGYAVHLVDYFGGEPNFVPGEWKGAFAELQRAGVVKLDRGRGTLFTKHYTFA